jgi:hypothetical protein
MPGHIWQRLADLLVAHTRAEEETWYLPLFGTGPQVADRIRDSIADHDEIRGIIGEAAVQPAGSAAWWRTVRPGGRRCPRGSVYTMLASALG